MERDAVLPCVHSLAVDFALTEVARVTLTLRRHIPAMTMLAAGVPIALVPGSVGPDRDTKAVLGALVVTPLVCVPARIAVHSAPVLHSLNPLAIVDAAVIPTVGPLPVRAPVQHVASVQVAIGQLHHFLFLRQRPPVSVGPAIGSADRGCEDVIPFRRGVPAHADVVRHPAPEPRALCNTPSADDSLCHVLLDEVAARLRWVVVTGRACVRGWGQRPGALRRRRRKIGVVGRPARRLRRTPQTLQQKVDPLHPPRSRPRHRRLLGKAEGGTSGRPFENC